MTDHWNEGDLVRLKSGGPQMVVDRMIHYSDNSTSVYCVWFENDRKQESSFPPSGLEEYGRTARTV
jgi:uncharacterized protein YodC (DUF2158 family)